jgi:hypothetical protein
MKIESRIIAPCGMNCGICIAYLREKNKCPGCREFDNNEPVSIARCKIRNCELIKEGELNFCSAKCDNYPCTRLKNLDKRYRTKYNMSMIENLKYIKKKGVDKLLEKETIKWKCSNCGGTISCHKGICSECGIKKQKEKIYIGG